MVAEFTGAIPPAQVGHTEGEPDASITSLLGIPAIAFSLASRGHEHLDSAARVARGIQRMAEALDRFAAAQTLGKRTMSPEGMLDLIEGKFVDALRSVAAEMTMEELHEKRGQYVKRVREAVAGDLTKNGLELESASLTQLDQTGMEFFNPSNAFDAEGLSAPLVAYASQRALRLADRLELFLKVCAAVQYAASARFERVMACGASPAASPSTASIASPCTKSTVGPAPPKSARCSEPPLPLQIPVALPTSSAINGPNGEPLPMGCPWLRWLPVM